LAGLIGYLPQYLKRNPKNARCRHFDRTFPKQFPEERETVRIEWTIQGNSSMNRHDG